MPPNAVAPAGAREQWERDKRYLELVELAPDGILIHDGQYIVLANAAAVRLAGAAHRRQLIGQPIDMFLHPPFLKALQAQLTRGQASDLAAPVRDTLRRLDGAEIEIEVRAIAFMDGDQPSAHVVVRDITERLAAEQAARHVEQLLHQAQRMESVGLLAGGVAHEVNNMMAVVLGFADFLARDARLPPDCTADVREIMKAAERAATVTRQLLAFSRRAVHRPRAVDLCRAIRELEPVLRRLLGAGRQLLVASDAGCRVWVDPGQLEQVVINLSLNARDAMPDGGTLSISTRESDLPVGSIAADGTAIPIGRYAVVIVRDTGIGMDSATLARIFEPFFTTKPVGQGTGLGLAAAQGILVQSTGFIGVVSAPGEGTTFTLYLPILPSDSAPDRRGEERPPATDVAYRGVSVLVVDDEAALRGVAARSLEHAGFRVVQAADGIQALEMVDRHGPPQVVITDLIMPGMSGAALARRLRDRWPALPVIFMSGYPREELQRQGALVADGELLAKPITPGELVASVAAALARAATAETG